eukprot:CAMPEP_0197321122 /NCGR_PEP_ID=MMETSP0891-20130614/63357_1 /TAXON_ID=44058 ORGANISM="Aureoumbra lagunensis, Strain CCMP1510" /NCGR_SAMPLE_ID=MMETSP0891 /ASSEMBLY_ACC=CAM_ASM_000534 /LENGTH=2397 /DNA_ID=CAMNT_0042812825 /DNA_START=105 /DNA_END=7298 /DNA_ORIENTATION=-
MPASHHREIYANSATNSQHQQQEEMNRLQLTCEEEEAVREGFQRLARFERYRRDVIFEAQFLEVFMAEIAPHVSRKLALSLWQAISGDGYQLSEDRFVQALALARRGSINNKVELALAVAARFAPGTSHSQNNLYWNTPVPSCRSVVALLRHLGEDGLIRIGGSFGAGAEKENSVNDAENKNNVYMPNIEERLIRQRRRRRRRPISSRIKMNANYYYHNYYNGEGGDSNDDAAAASSEEEGRSEEDLDEDIEENDYEQNEESSHVYDNSGRMQTNQTDALRISTQKDNQTNPIALRSQDLAGLLGKFSIHEEISIRDFIIADSMRNNQKSMAKEEDSASSEEYGGDNDEEIIEEERRLSSSENDERMDYNDQHEDDMIEENAEARDVCNYDDDDSSTGGIRARGRKTRVEANYIPSNYRQQIYMTRTRNNQNIYHQRRQFQQRRDVYASYNSTSAQNRRLNTTDLQVLEQIKSALANIITTCLDGWSLSIPTDDRSSSATSATKNITEKQSTNTGIAGYNSSGEEEGPARRRQRTAIAALRASTPELGLPDSNYGIQQSDQQYPQYQEATTIMEEEINHTTGGMHTLLAVAGQEKKKDDDDDSSCRAAKLRRRSSSREDEQQITIPSQAVRPPKRQDEILLDALYCAMRDTSLSAAIDIDTVIEFMTRPRLHWRCENHRKENSGRLVWEAEELNTDLEPYESRGPVYLTRPAARRLFFILLDENGSGVAHREHFIRALSCACGSLTNEKNEQENNICTQILHAPIGTLRACIEDLIHVRLHLRAPLGRSCEQRVCKRYLNQFYVKPGEPFLRQDEEYRAIPCPWLQLWHDYLQSTENDTDDLRNSIPPIDNRCIIYPEPACDLEQQVFINNKYETQTIQVDPCALAFHPQAELHTDFELCPAVLYNALAAWYNTVHAIDFSIARVAKCIPDDRAPSEKKNNSAIFELRPPRCIIWYKPSERVPIYMTCNIDDTVEELVKKAYDIIFNQQPMQQQRNARTGNRRRRQNAGFQSSAHTLTPIPKDRLKVVITRSMYRREYKEPLPADHIFSPYKTGIPSEYTFLNNYPTNYGRQICFLDHLNTPYHGAPPTRTNYIDSCIMRNAFWQSSVGTVMQQRNVYDQKMRDSKDEAPTRGPSVGVDEADEKDDDRDEKHGLEEKEPVVPLEEAREKENILYQAGSAAKSNEQEKKEDVSTTQESSENIYPYYIEHSPMMLSDVTIELLLIEEDEEADISQQYTRTNYTAAPVTSTTRSLVPRGIQGEVGLRNLGNTCYINSVLQGLAHVPPLREYFASGEFRFDINPSSKFGANGKLAASFGELVKNLSESDEGLTPDFFKCILGAWDQTFAGYSQQDASEFFIKFFEGLGEDLNRIVDKPYVENPNVTLDPDEPLSFEEQVKLEKQVARECWKNHAHVREAHPITALFGGQLRRELICNDDQGEKSIGFDAFTSLTVPLYGEDQNSAGGYNNHDTLDVRCRIYFARQRLWPLDVVARVPLDATILDVLKVCSQCKLDSDSINDKPELNDHRYYARPHRRPFAYTAGNRADYDPSLIYQHNQEEEQSPLVASYASSSQNSFIPERPKSVMDDANAIDKNTMNELRTEDDDVAYVAPLLVENLVAMVPYTTTPATNQEKYLGAYERILHHDTRVRNNLLYTCIAGNTTHRLQIYEVVPEFIPYSPTSIKAERNRQDPDIISEFNNTTYCPATLRTLSEIDVYFMDNSRLIYFGETFLVRIVAGYTTGAMLKRDIWEHIRPWMDSVPSDDSRDHLCTKLFELRVCAKPGSEEDINGRQSVVGSEMLLPDAGHRVPDDDTILIPINHATDIEGCSFIVDIPRAARFRFNFRVMTHHMTHISCAPPPPKPPIALESCLRTFCAPEIVTKYSKVQTRRNNGEYTETQHTCRVTISRAPPFLALILKRFMVTERGRKRKLSDRVAFPIRGLDLREFMSPRPHHSKDTQEQNEISKLAQAKDEQQDTMIDSEMSVKQTGISPLEQKDAAATSLSTIAAQEFTAIDASDILDKGAIDDSTLNGASSVGATNKNSAQDEIDDELNIPPIYDLISVVNHFGGLEHGHYTCFARRVDNTGWLEFDDKRVEKIEMSEVCDDPAAYVLLYARRDTNVANPLEYIRQRFHRVRNECMDIESLLRPPQPPPPPIQTPPLATIPNVIDHENSTAIIAHPTAQAMQQALAPSSQDSQIQPLSAVPELGVHNEPKGNFVESTPVHTCTPLRSAHLGAGDVVADPSSPINNIDQGSEGSYHNSPNAHTGDNYDENFSLRPNYLNYTPDRVRRADDTDDLQEDDDDDNRARSDDDDDHGSTSLYYPDNNSVKGHEKHVNHVFDQWTYPNNRPNSVSPGADDQRSPIHCGGYEADGDNNFDEIDAEDIHGEQDELDAEMVDSSRT